MASLPQAPPATAHPRPGVRPAPPPIARLRRRRRPSGEPPPLPRHLNASGKWWLGSSIVVAVLWGVGAATGHIAVVDLVDTRVLQAVGELRSPGLTRIAEVAGGLATPAALKVIWLVNMVVLVACRRWRHLLVWLGVGLVVANLADTAATTLQRPRPYGVEVLGPWSGFSMPSVPVTVLAAFLVSTLYALVPAGRWRTVGKWVVVAVLAGPPRPGCTSRRTTPPTSSPAWSSAWPHRWRPSGCSRPTRCTRCGTPAGDRRTWT